MEKALDRINEAYFGKLGESFQIKTRERVNWIVGNISGEKVLEIGCSQGLISILAGREGKMVQGIDILQESINIANEYLEKESDVIRKSVTFECDNFITKSFDEKFDTIIASEVLEHIGDDSTFLSKTKELIEDNGRLVITVPFGINDYFDHKRTYYIYGLIKSLSENFYIEKIEFLEKWIGVLCIKVESSLKVGDYLEKYMPQFEKNLYQVERNYLNDIKVKEQKIQSAVEEKSQVVAKLNDANEKYKFACTNIDEYKSREAEYKKRVGLLENFDKLANENKALAQQLQETRQMLQESNNNLLISSKDVEIAKLNLQHALEMKGKEIELNQSMMRNYEYTVEKQTKEIESLISNIIPRNTSESTNLEEVFELLRQSEEKLELKQQKCEQILTDYYKLKGLYESKETAYEQLTDLVNEIEKEHNEILEKNEKLMNEYSKLQNLYVSKEAECDKVFHESENKNEEISQEKKKYDLLLSEYSKIKNVLEEKEKSYVQLSESNKGLNEKLLNANTKYKFVVTQVNEFKTKLNKLSEENNYYKATIKELSNSQIKKLDEQEQLLKIIRDVQNDLNRLKRAKLVRLSYKYWSFMKKFKSIIKGVKR